MRSVASSTCIERPCPGSPGLHVAFVAVALFACLAGRVVAGDNREPDRKELWVPSQNLQEVLKKHPNAVLLDRAQYEALIRDAGKVKLEGAEEKPPVEVVIEAARLRAELPGGAMSIVIKAAIDVNALTDQWTEVKLLSVPADVVLTRFDQSDVILSDGSAGKGVTQRVLAVHGKGRHHVEMEFRAPIRRTGRVCHADVPYLAKPFSITAVPGGTARVSPRWPMHDGVALVPTTAASASSTFATLTWIEEAGAGAGDVINEVADCLADVGKSGITTHVRVRLDATGGVLPMTFRLRLPSPDLNVVSVSNSYVAAWKQVDGALEITRRGGFMQSRDFSFVLLKPLPDSAGTIPVAIDVPRLEGAALVTANVGLHVDDGFELQAWESPGSGPDDAFRAWEKTQRPAADVTVLRHFEVAPEAVKVNVRRLGDRFSADVDNHIVLSTHEMTLDRTLALHGEEGRVDRAVFAIPANEQFLGLSAAAGVKIEWKQLGGAAIEVTWPGGLTKGQGTTLLLKTRQDLPADLGPENPKSEVQNPKPVFAVENIRLAQATRVAGYVALDFDESWKVATMQTTGLETRDARTTPVKGRMAWFTLRDYKLVLDIARNESVLDAAVVAYALPRAKNVEIEGQFMLHASRAPLRKFEVKLAPAVAKLLRVDSPLIGEQSLNEASGVWRFTFRKELLGDANVRWRMSLAASPKSGGGSPEPEVQSPKSNPDKPAEYPGLRTLDSGLKTLVAALPDIAMPSAHHFSGQWIVEANTDTEITFDARGVQPLDLLHAAAVEGYAPRHRVIAAYGYTAAPHEVKLTATRHDPSPLVSAMVEDMRLTSVLSHDGSSRHEAALRVRHNGQQFFALRVPHGAMILSAKVGGDTVKPVRAGEDEVRVPLASRIGAEASVPVTVVYELGGSPWSASGAEKIAPPTVADDVPVLSVFWRVYAPDGMTYHASGGFTGEPERRDAPLLLGRVASFLSYAGAPARAQETFAYKQAADSGALVSLTPPYPKAQFVGTPVPLPPSPASEAKEEPEIRVARAYGDAGNYDAAKKRLGGLLRKNPPDQAARALLGRIEADERRSKEIMAQSDAARRNAKADSPRQIVAAAIEQSPEATTMKRAGAGKSGLISLDLNVPTSGRWIEFGGHQKPVLLTLRYESWERQMRRSALWALAGMVAYLMIGRPGPWLRTFFVALVLTCLPLLWLPAWIVACNAFLAGWLAVFAAHVLCRTARRLERFGARLASPSVAVTASLALMAGALTSRAEDSPPLDPAAHTVIVPYDGTKSPDGQKANRYYLDYDVFQELWDLAKENRRPPKPRDTDADVKPEAVITSALYDAQVRDDGLQLTARLSVITRGGSWVKLALPFKEKAAAVGSARLDGNMIALRDGEMLIEKPGAHSVEISLSVHKEKGWANLSVDLPQAAASVASVTVPVSEGRPGFGRTNDALVVEQMRDGRRVFTLPLGGARKLEITRTTARVRDSGSAPATVNNDLRLEILPRLERVHAVLKFGFAGTERDRFEIVLEDSLRPVKWDAPNLRDWKMRKENGKLLMEATLLRPVADGYAITVDAERVLVADTGPRTAPLINGAARRSTSVLHVVHAEELQFAPGAGAERVSGAGVASTLTEGGSYRLREGAPLAYTMSGAEDRSAAQVDALYQLSAQKAEIVATMLLDSGRGALTEAVIGLPAGFEVQTLAGPRVQSWHRDGGKVFLRLDAQPQHEARVLLHVAKTSAQPVAEWKLEPLAVPQFRKFSGHVLVAVHAADDVKLTFDAADGKVREADPATLNTSISVTPPLTVKRALNVEKADWSAQVALSRQTPRFVADTVLLAKATDEGFALSQQVGLSVEQGALDHVKILLPKELPEGVVTGAAVRDVQSRITGPLREYEVTFQTGVLDRADFTLGIDLPLEGGKTLPVVQVDGAARTNVYFITDNVSAHEMKTTAANAASATKDAVPFLPDGLLRPQFYRAQSNAEVKLAFSQLETSAGNAAIVTLAEITTALRANGDRWEIAEFTLANRSLQFLPVRLAEGAELIEVSVGGQNVRADSGGSEKSKAKGDKLYLVPLIQMRAGELAQRVRLVYRLPAEQGAEATHALHEPELVGLAAERTIWNVWVPEKFSAKSFDGNMEEIGEKGRELEKMQSALSDVARLNREIADGKISGRDAQVAWNMACRRLDEITVQKQQQKPADRGRLSESVNELEFREGSEKEKLGKKVRQLDTDVDKALQQQRVVLTENAVTLKKQGVAPGMRDASGQFSQYKKNTKSDAGKFTAANSTLTLGGVSSVQNWSGNITASPTNMPRLELANNIATATQNLDVNDNVSVAAKGLAENQTMTSNSIVLSSTAGTPLSGSVTGNVTLNSNINGSFANNARAGQNTQLGVATRNAGAATITGTGALTASGSGTLALGGANSYTGDVTVNGADQIAVTNGATGALQLSGANTYTGTTTVVGGTSVTSGTTNSLPAVTLNGGSTLTYNGNGTAGTAIPALESPVTKSADVENVKRHLQMAASYENLGDHDNAIKQFQDALRVDKHNTAARRGIEEVEKRKQQHFQSARDQTRARMLNDVNKGWEEQAPVRLEGAAPAAGAAGVALQPKAAPIVVDSIGGLIQSPAAPAAKMKNVLPANPQVQPAADGFSNMEEVSRPLTPQLKPVGRVSLAVDVPLEGRVYSFSKVKDHALIEVTVVRPLEPRQVSALVVLAAGLVFLALIEVMRRQIARRRLARVML